MMLDGPDLVGELREALGLAGDIRQPEPAPELWPPGDERVGSVTEGEELPVPRLAPKAACGADAGTAAGEPDRLASDDGRPGDDGGVEAVSTCYAKEARRGLLTPSGFECWSKLGAAANAEVAQRLAVGVGIDHPIPARHRPGAAAVVTGDPEEGALTSQPRRRPLPDTSRYPPQNTPKLLFPSSKMGILGHTSCLC